MSKDLLSTENLFGKEMSDKQQIFHNELKRIEKENIDFFKHRKSHLQSQEHDSIFNHCIIQTESGRVGFGFTDNEISKQIQQDCIEAFRKIYPTI